MEKQLDEEHREDVAKLVEQGQRVYAHKHDLFKYFATLSSGAILFVSAFMERQAGCPKNRWPIIAAMILFTISMMTSIGVMFFAGRQSIILGLAALPWVRRDDKKTGQREAFLHGCEAAASIAFSLAVILVGLFFVISF